MTALGMGLVFAALGLLWGVMALMTRLFKAGPEKARWAPQWPWKARQPMHNRPGPQPRSCSPRSALEWRRWWPGH